MAMNATIGDVTFHVGDTIGVKYRLIEKEKVSGKAKREVKEEIRERVQEFEGIVLSIGGAAENKHFTVRRIASDAVGVERVFPVVSPWIKGIVVKKQAIVRRAKLYYLREMIGKKATKLKEKAKVRMKKGAASAVKPAGNKEAKKAEAKSDTAVHEAHS